jgi:AcrR family transcriptional regulator
VSHGATDFAIREVGVSPALGSAARPERSPTRPAGPEPSPDDGCPAARTRKRGAALEAAIHQAVFEELAEVGYAAFTIESVAARAQTGKTSIYRRWETKHELVLDAFCSRFGGPGDLADPALLEHATTRDVLVQIGRRIVEVAGAMGEVVRAVACEVRHDPGLASAVEERVRCPKREALMAVLARGVERGEIRPEAQTETFAELLPATLMYRGVLMNRPVTDEQVVEIVDTVIMPLLRVSGAERPDQSGRSRGADVAHRQDAARVTGARSTHD